MTKEPLYWNLLTQYWETISIYDGEDRFLCDFRSAPERVQHLFAAHWLQSEVVNGGFQQLFENPTGVLAPEGAVGMRAIGLDDVASIVEQAVAFFGPEYPRDQEARGLILSQRVEEQMGELVDDEEEDVTLFDSLDDEFYAALPWGSDRFEAAANAYASNVA